MNVNRFGLETLAHREYDHHQIVFQAMHGHVGAQVTTLDARITRARIQGIPLFYQNSQERSRLIKLLHTHPFYLTSQAGRLTLQFKGLMGGGNSGSRPIPSSSAQNLLALGDAAREEGDEKEAARYYREALSNAPTESEREQIQSRLQASTSVSSVPTPPTINNLEQFHAQFETFERLLRAHHPKEATVKVEELLCLEELLRFDLTRIENITPYFDRLMCIVQDICFFQSLDTNQIYEIKEKILQLVRDIILVHFQRGKDLGIQLTDSQLESALSALQVHAEWLLSSESAFSLTELYFAIDYTSDLISMMRDSRTLAEKWHVHERSTSIIPKILSLSISGTETKLLKPVAPLIFSFFKEPAEGSLVEKKFLQLLTIQAYGELIKAGERGAKVFFEALFHSHAHASTDWKIPYQIIKKIEELIPFFSQQERKALIYGATPDRHGLEVYAHFNQSLEGAQSLPNWRIRETAVKVLLKLLEFNDPLITTAVHAAIIARTVDPHPLVRKLLECDQPRIICTKETKREAIRQLGAFSATQTKELSLLIQTNKECATAESRAKEENLRKDVESFIQAVQKSTIVEIAETRHELLGNKAYAEGEYARAIDYYKDDLQVKQAFCGMNTFEAASAYLRYAEAQSLSTDSTIEAKREAVKQLGSFSVTQAKELAQLIHMNRNKERATVESKAKEETLRKGMETFIQAVQRSEGIEIAETTDELLGNKACAEGQYARAIDYYKKDMRIKKTRYGDDALEAADAHVRCGVALGCQAMYKEALEEYSQALAIYLRTQGPDHPTLGTLYNNIANAHRSLGQHSKTLEFDLKALPIYLKAPKPDLPTLGATYNNIALAYEAQGQHDKALEFHQKALATLLEAWGSDHPTVGDCHNNVANAHRALGQHDKALESHRQALSIRQTTLGQNHFKVGDSYHNIASVYQAQGHHAQALVYDQKALDIQVKIPNYSNVHTTFHSLGTTYKALGQHDKALESYHIALTIRLKTVGPNHPSVGDSYNHIAIVYQIQGKNDKALEFYEMALAVRLKAPEPNHSAVASSYNNIAIVYQALGQHGKALQYFEQALALRLKTLEPDHPSVGDSYNNVAIVYQAQGQYDQALQYAENALAIRIRTLGPHHFRVGDSYHNIAIIYQTQGEHTKAFEFYQKALVIWLETWGPGHLHVGNVYNGMANACRALGLHDQALEFHQKAEAVQLKMKAERSPVGNASSSVAAAGAPVMQGEYVRTEQKIKAKLKDNHNFDALLNFLDQQDANGVNKANTLRHGAGKITEHTMHIYELSPNQKGGNNPYYCDPSQKRLPTHFQQKIEWRGEPLQHTDQLYDYSAPSDAQEATWTDFANKFFGGGYDDGEGNAQEEVLFGEAPGLNAVACPEESFITRKTREGDDEPGKGSPTPILVKGVQRVQQHRLYGELVAPDQMRDLPEIQTVNYLAIAAPRILKRTRENQIAQETVYDLFNTAYAGFMMVKENREAGKEVLIHTGPLGAGLFYNNPKVTILLQYLAAQAVGVKVQFHGVESEDVIAALQCWQKMHSFVGNSGDKTIQEILDRLISIEGRELVGLKKAGKLRG